MCAEDVESVFWYVGVAFCGPMSNDCGTRCINTWRVVLFACAVLMGRCLGGENGDFRFVCRSLSVDMRYSDVWHVCGSAW